MFCVYVGIGAEEKQWLLIKRVESTLRSALQAGTVTLWSPCALPKAPPLKEHGKCNEKGLDLQSEP